MIDWGKGLCWFSYWVWKHSCPERSYWSLETFMSRSLLVKSGNCRPQMNSTQHILSRSHDCEIKSNTYEIVGHNYEIRTCALVLLSSLSLYWCLPAVLLTNQRGSSLWSTAVWRLEPRGAHLTQLVVWGKSRASPILHILDELETESLSPFPCFH